MRFGWYCGPLGSDVVLVPESAKDLLATDPVLARLAGSGGQVTA
jgi:hypothetical protein